MWKELSDEGKKEYKKMILVFAGLTELFAQKSDDENDIPAPIINSKFQENVFAKAFNGTIEDIANTPFDVSLDVNGEKYLVGVKTFGIASGEQKIQQFKSDSKKWTEYINKMNANAKGKPKEKIDRANYNLYKVMAREISEIRNDRIASGRANIRGLKPDSNITDMVSVYHVLKTSKKNSKPCISVAEIKYEEIDINKIEILGCTGKNSPANFKFYDGRNTYKYTASDSQLYMDFTNAETVDEWDVAYANAPYELFSGLAEMIANNEKQLSNKPAIVESQEWKINVEPFSGLNSFYSVGSKIPKDARDKQVAKLKAEYIGIIPKKKLDYATRLLKNYLKSESRSKEAKLEKVKLRNRIERYVKKIGNENFYDAFMKKLYRPMHEVYIPIPGAKKFHSNHPDFFGNGIGTFKTDGRTLAKDKEERTFTLVFEPSGNEIEALITQESGKGIESTESQSRLGEWLLHDIFRLKDYEPLTEDRLLELGINGIRLYKTTDGKIHLEFIWIDDELDGDSEESNRAD